MLDVPTTDKRFGKPQPCTECAGVDAGRHCGLSSEERGYSADSIRGKGDMSQMLRWLVTDCCASPVGMVTLWGKFGTAKSMTVQAVVAELVRQRKPARFAHAKTIEQRWFDDMHGDTSNAKVFLEAPVLAIDELDKCNLKSDWVRQQFQLLMDTRYRAAVDGEQLTLITLNGRPEDVLPGDIASRLNDGRFYRQWPPNAEPNKFVVERWGAKALPGVIELVGDDARPYMAPDWVEDK